MRRSMLLIPNFLNVSPSCPSYLTEIDHSALADDPKVVDGAPCAIQVVGRRLQDEELLGGAQVIADVLEK